jgi:hypothetical protein
MLRLLDHPFEFLFVTFLILLMASITGAWWEKRHPDDTRTDTSFQAIQAGTLGLLGLLLGFSFAMAVTRYDLRIDESIDEANSIHTCWLRAAFLPQPLEQQSRQLIVDYTAVRLHLRDSKSPAEIDNLLRQSRAIQHQLWTVAASNDSPTARDSVTALYISSVNQLIDIANKRREAATNRIPAAAWVLVIFIAAIANGIVGYGSGSKRRWLLIVLPLVVSCSLVLICDLDSSRSNLLQIEPPALNHLQDDLLDPSGFAMTPGPSHASR